MDTDQPFDPETLSTSTSVNVVSDVPSTKSTMTTPREYIEVGQPAYFYVIAIDRLGNSIAVSGQSSAFSVTVTGSISGTRAAEVSNSLSDRTGSVGSYYGSFTPLYAETYTLTVSVDGYPLDQGSSTHIASVFLSNEADYFKVTGAPVFGVVGSSLTFIINQWNLEYNLDMNMISTTFLSKLSRPQSQVSLTLSPLGTGAGDAELTKEAGDRREPHDGGGAARAPRRRAALADAARARERGRGGPLITKRSAPHGYEGSAQSRRSGRARRAEGFKEKGLFGAGAGLRFPQSGARRRGGVLARRVDGGRRLRALRVAGRRSRFARGVRPLFGRRRRRRRPAGRESFRCVRAADVVVPARCFKTWRVVDRAEERLPGGARGRRLPRCVGLEARRRRRRQGGLRRRLAPGDRRGHCPKGPIIGRGRVRVARDLSLIHISEPTRLRRMS